MDSSIKDILGIDFDLNDVKDPFELYRKMRPQYFSDSHVVRKMTPEIFRYNMSRLSTDMKQDMFEDMTRQMVCKLITPNLVPQTGPTGGGDGKTDIETHPVDESVSDKWYYADACKGQEKWAFAISCKSEWKPKIDSDVKKIVGTERGFTKIFFCTNQLVPSKNKADLFDKYKKLYNVEVTILDQNWYEQAVFENDCYDIAVKTLNLDPRLLEVKEEGPEDKKKKDRLKEVEVEIQNIKVGEGLYTTYVELLLEAAILSRGLEEPKITITGRFALTLEQAQEHGTSQQVFIIIYERAWTAFYWFKDANEMYRLYLQLRKMLDEEVNVVRIEKLYNLRNLVNLSYSLNLIQPALDITKEKEYWKALYNQLSVEKDHQSSFLYLKICMLQTKLLSQQLSSEDVNDTLIQLKEAIESSVHHLDIPFDTHVQILKQIGAFISNNPIYEELVDSIANISSRMHSEIEYADIHYNRGVQNLENNEYILAIKHFGKCIIAYQKETTKGNLVKASAFLAMSYQGIDLLYSAKVLFIRTLFLLLHKAETEGSLDHILVTVLFELCRLELKIGQLNSFLNWLYMLDCVVRAHPSFYDESYSQQRQELDAVLATVILSSVPENSFWEYFPTVCDRFGLSVSKDAALYVLGYDDEISKEFKEIVMKEDDWKDRVSQLSSSGITLFPLSYSTKDKSEIETLVNGCHIIATYKSNINIQVYAEAFLAFFESYMATMTITDMAIATPKILLTIKVKDSGKTEVQNGNRTNEYTIRINKKKVDEKIVWNTCAQLLARFLTRNSMTKDFTNTVKKKEMDDNIGERLAIIGNYYREFKLSFLPEYKSYLELWCNKDMKRYPIKSQLHSSTTNYTTSSKQSTQIITDLIDFPLWDKAQWSGCGYMLPYDGSSPAILILLFKKYEFAKQIFEKWEDDYRNRKLNLKLTFITGVDNKNPKWYKVVIAPDMKKIFTEDKNKEPRYVVATSRFHLMQSTNDTNLKIFKQLHAKFRYAGITAAEMIDNKITSNPNKSYPHVIPVTNIDFREAWTIGENDPDSMAILSEDHPIIPEGKESTAPVIELIKNKINKYGKLH